MSLIKKFKTGDRVRVIDGSDYVAVGQTGTVTQANLIRDRRPFWWYGVRLDNPTKGQDSSYMFRDDAIKKI